MSSTARPETTDAAKTVTASREIPVQLRIPKISATGRNVRMRLTATALQISGSLSQRGDRDECLAGDLICVVTGDVTPADVALYKPT